MAGIDQLLKAAQLGQMIGAPVGNYLRDKKNRELEVADREEARKLKLEDIASQRAYAEDQAAQGLRLQAALGKFGGIVPDQLQSQRQTAYDQGGIPMPQTYKIHGVNIDLAMAQQFESEQRKQEISDLIAKAGGIEEAKQRVQFPFEQSLLTQRQTGQTAAQQQDFSDKMSTLQKQHDLAVEKDDKQEKTRLENDMALLKARQAFEISQGQGKGIGTKLKPLESSQKENLSQAQNAFSALEALKNVYSENSSAVGGTLSELGGPGRLFSPFQTKIVDQALGKTAQEVGRFFEGGKLSDVDFPRYKNEILPSYTLNKKVRDATFDNLEKGMARKYLAEVETNRNAGSDTSEIERSPFYKKMEDIASGAVATENKKDPARATSQNSEAIKWLLDNPNDENAPAIRKELGL